MSFEKDGLSLQYKRVCVNDTNQCFIPQRVTQPALNLSVAHDIILRR